MRGAGDQGRAMASLGPRSGLEQGVDAGPGDLHADAKDEEGAEAVYDLFTARAEAMHYAGRIGVADIDQQTDEDDRDKEGAQVEKMCEQVFFFFVGSKR